jgi:hypothetical protein
LVLQLLQLIKNQQEDYSAVEHQQNLQMECLAKYLQQNKSQQHLEVVCLVQHLVLQHLDQKLMHQKQTNLVLRPSQILLKDYLNQVLLGYSHKEEG